MHAHLMVILIDVLIGGGFLTRLFGGAAQLTPL